MRREIEREREPEIEIERREEEAEREERVIEIKKCKVKKEEIFMMKLIGNRIITTDRMYIPV